MRQPGRFSVTFRTILLGSLATAALLAGSSAAAAEVRALSLPAGPLEGALNALAAQTDEQLVYAPALVAGRRVPALAGHYDIDAALARLLASSEIVATRVGPRLIVLKPARAAGGRPARPPEATARAALPFGADPDGPVGAPQSSAAVVAAPAAAAASPTTVSEVEVTGTHIRGVGAGPSPIVVLDRTALERSGYATIAGALNVLPQNFGGLDTEGTVATGGDQQGSNTAYGTGVNLRGLGANATLVLVNGRRVGGSGTSGDFVDVSSLPTIAVARVDVLLDGASAIYGSDAVGGVVNVILRRDLEGGEIRASAGTGAGDTPREYQLGAVVGHRWPTGGLLLAYEYYQRDALAAADRDYTATSDLRPFGGTDHRLTTAYPGNIVGLNPATGVSGPYYGIPAGQAGLGLRPSDFQAGVLNASDRQAGLDVLPAQTRQSAYLALDQALGDKVEITGDARYGFRAARTRIAAQTSTFTVRSSNPFFVSPNGTTSNQIQYSFAGELPNPVIRATAESLTGSLGARVQLAHDWALDGYLAFAQEIDEARSGGVVNSAILAEALGNVADRPETAYAASRDGYFNPYTGVAANPAAVTSAIASGFTSSRMRSQVRTVNLQADGPLFDLPGGALKLAVGVNGREESFRRGGSSYTSTVTPTALAGVSGRRRVGAAFAEIRAPLVGPDNARPGLAALELSGAIRAEHYSDFGDTVDPKAGVLWAPVADLNLRGTYGRSFRAPGLNQLLAAQTVSPIILSLAGADALTVSEQGGNPGLKPETADTWTLGFDYQPHWSKRSRLSLTWFDTDFRNRISRPVNDNLLGALEDPRFAAFVQRVSPAANAADLALVNGLITGPNALSSAGLFPATDYVAIVDLRNVNTGELEVRGLDLQVSQTLTAYDGVLELGADATRLLRYAQRLTPTSAATEQLGLVTYPARLRGRLSADWSRGVIAGGVSLNYLSDFHDVLGARIDSLTTVDLRLRVKADRGLLAGTALSLSVRNLFNTAPPFYDNPFGFAYDPDNADVIGRFVRLELTRSW